MSGPQVRPAVYVSAWFINLGTQHEKHSETFKHHDALARLKPDGTFNRDSLPLPPLPPSRPFGVLRLCLLPVDLASENRQGGETCPAVSNVGSRPSFSLPQTMTLTRFSYSFGHSATLHVHRFELIPPALSLDPTVMVF